MAIKLNFRLSTPPWIDSTELARRNDLHIARKLWHMGTGVVGIGIYFFSGLNQELLAQGLLIFAVVAFLGDFLRLKLPALNKMAVTFFGGFMRESERDSFSGLPFYAAGVALALILYSPHIAVLAVFFLIFADPISSYIGIMFGKDKIIKNKSWQGATAGFVICFFITFIYGSYHIGPTVDVFVFAFFAGLAGAFSELLSLLFDDNLTIPIASGALMSFINLFIPVFF